MWVLVSIGAGAAPTGHFVDREFVELVAVGRDATWSPNRIAAEIHLDGEVATFRDLSDNGIRRTCPYVARGKEITVSCSTGSYTLKLVGNTLEAHMPLGDTLRRTSWTLEEHWRRRAREGSLAQLPRVGGTWRRGEEWLELSVASTADTSALRLEPCDRDGQPTVCMTHGDERFALVDDQFAPATVLGGCTCGGGEGHDYVAELLPGARWIRDAPCDRGICSFTHDNDEPIRWVPVGDRVDARLWDHQSLLGGTLQVEVGPRVEQVQVRVRAHTSAALFLDDDPIDLGELGAVTDWMVLESEPFLLPETLTAAPISLTRDEILRRTEVVLAEPRADATYRARAAKAAQGCVTPDTSPCRTGIGALEVEITAFAGYEQLDRVTFLLRRGFGG